MPNRLVSIVARASSSGASAALVPTVPITPALLTRTSRRPGSASTRSRRLATLSGIGDVRAAQAAATAEAVVGKLLCGALGRDGIPGGHDHVMSQLSELPGRPHGRFPRRTGSTRAPRCRSSITGRLRPRSELHPGRARALSRGPAGVGDDLPGATAVGLRRADRAKRRALGRLRGAGRWARRRRDDDDRQSDRMGVRHARVLADGGDCPAVQHAASTSRPAIARVGRRSGPLRLRRRAAR